MATSAYKGDQLKKNPLLGTATQSVASLAPRKERLMSLYGEAKAMAGQGRPGMKGTLAGRHARLATADQAALGDLTGRYQSLQQKASTIRNDEAKKKFFSDHPDKSAVEAEEAYEMDLADKVKIMQDEGNVYAAEYDRRNHALQQRIDDYNLFLGSY